MNKDKEWAKGQLEYYIKAVGDPFNNRTHAMINAYKNVEHIINQLDEPQKPVVPQFVADYIENYKGRVFSLQTWLNLVNGDDEFESKAAEWLYGDSQEEMLKREYLLIDAIRCGYEVEKEKEYKVFLPTGDKVRLAIDDSEVYFSSTDFVSREYKDTFTEAEIKAIDERYWAFAEEVTK